MRRLLLPALTLCLLAVSPASSRAASSLSGTITYVGTSTLTISTGGREAGVIAALDRGAGRLTSQEWPYVWGGGHGTAGTASIGIKGGPGYNGRRVGYDCSGSVAAVLSAAGLWPAGAPVPNDAGVISELRSQGLITRGPGAAPNEVTLYDDPGVHIFMNIDGRFFGTSDGGGGNPKGGPTWLDDGAPDAYNHAFKQWHFVPAALKSRTIYGQSYTFQTAADPTLTAGASVGDKVSVGYVAKAGSMLAQTIAYRGTRTVTGTVSAIAVNLGTVTVTFPNGTAITLTTSAVPELIEGLVVGDTISVTYSRESGGVLIPRALKITAPPATTTTPAPAPAPAPTTTTPYAPPATTATTTATTTTPTTTVPWQGPPPGYWQGS